MRDVAQSGSALRSGRRGRWFESSHPDQKREATFRNWKWLLFFGGSISVKDVAATW